MPTTATRQPKPATFESVWALTQENAKGMKELRESQKETDRIMKRIEKNLGGMGQSLGMLIETLIAAKLWEKFDRLHYHFDQAYQRIPIYDKKRHAVTEIDILLTDDTYVMAVEVKTQFDKISDVDYHLQRMERILKWPPAACKGKTLLGAIAGGTVTPEVRDYAHVMGLFVLELTGEAVSLARRPAGFKAREW